ncbi:helix-turn-helix domain-containing protein [Undibacterium sp. TJN19]|uniref:helix-turn-helix domain-containing protein n=1 Tax=Undibacterium sp. TJN19 TaxID=3413055 RepID=UPI003BF3E901
MRIEIDVHDVYRTYWIQPVLNQPSHLQSTTCLDASPVSHQIFPAHAKLKHLLMHTLVVKLHDCEASIPATLCPAIMLFIRGGGTIINPGQDAVESPRFFLRGPAMQPMQVRYPADTLTISVCLRPGMLFQATGLAVSDIVESYITMDQVADKTCLEKFLRSLDDNDDIQHIVSLFHNFLLDILDHRQRSSIGAAFLAAHKKIFFPLLDLSEYFGIGQRQLERRVRDAFGVTLRDVRRVVRFGQSLPYLIKPDIAWGDLTQVAQDSGYYDQAHMHREYTELAGITPTQLRQKINSQDPAYWIYRISNEDFYHLFLSVE